jgi:MoaA/NifB/PqqE/SkfB family radical SAM enzyme
MTWNKLDPRYLHIELSTYCNAACPLCPRYYEGTTLVRPDLELDQITIDKFKKYFPDAAIQKLYKILYCGTMGDPVMAKDCYDIFEYVNTINANCEQTVHTNGGMRNPTFWSKMGVLFQRPKMKLIFSIDGLGDTNHIYRRNVEWDKLMNNVQAFINSGGNATWEFLIFKHNEHQVETARELSSKLGFKNFLAKRALGFDNPVQNTLEPRMVFNHLGKLDYKIYPPERAEYQNAGSSAKFKDNFYELNMDEYKEAKPIKFFPKTKKRINNFKDSQSSELGNYEKELDGNHVKCKSIYDHFTEVYINAKGILFPCCFVGTRFDSNVDNFLDHQLKAKINPRLEDLDLNVYSINEIISSGVLEEIFTESWTKKSIKHGKLAYCSETCGQNSPLDRIYL